MNKNVVICDLDGTLADVTHRLHYIKNPDGTMKPRAELDWDGFNEACRYDVPNNDVIEILHEVANLGACTHLGEYTGREVYILSGRNEVTRRRTVKWLKKYVYSYLDYDTHLIMRKADDRRPDTEVKLEMVQELGLTPDDVLCVLDDRQCVVDMWRKHGFRCLQVEAWEEKKTWLEQIEALINKKSADIEDPLRRFEFFKLLACVAKHEALKNMEPFLPDKYLRLLNMDITATQMVDYLGETDYEA